MQLNQIVHEPEAEETAPPLVVAHGLFGSARNWGPVAKTLARRRRVIALDMRNHGESPHTPTHTYADMAQDLADALAPFPEADLMGHSMGGKAAMVLALTHPPKSLRRLIVADIAPVAYTHSHLDYIRAMQGIDLAKLSRRSEAERLLAPQVEDRSLRAFLLHSLTTGPDGLRWRLNLDALGDAMPELVAFPEDLAAPYEGSALFLAGEHSDYALPHQDRIRALFPNARIVTLKNAGHWLHAEAPDAFARTVAAYLDA